MPPATNDIEELSERMLTQMTLEGTHSLFHIAATAICTATREVEHAVSRVKQGPVRPRLYDIRPEPTESRFPLAEYARDVYAGALLLLLLQRSIPLDMPPKPTNTPTCLSSRSIIINALSSNRSYYGSIALASIGDMPSSDADS